MKLLSLSLLLIIYLGSFGQTTFEGSYHAANNNEFNQLELTNDGGYIFAGGTNGVGMQSGDMYLVKTDSVGDTLWTRQYGGTANDYCYSFEQTEDNGYVLAGLTKSFGAGDYDVYLVKTDSIGDTLWTKTLGGSLRNRALDVIQTHDNGFAFCGYTSKRNGQSPRVFVGKTDPYGDTLWTKTNVINTNKVANSITETVDSNYVTI